MKTLITGASRGIGLFLMQEMLKQGYDVFGTTNTTSPAKEFEQHLTKVDVANPQDVQSWITKSVQEGDKIALINCAGINYNAMAHKADITKWKQVIDVNLTGSFNTIHAVLPFMRSAKFGRIINISSVVAQKGVPGTSAYAASKAALWGLTKSIAAETAGKGITVNCLNLGYFDAGMIAEVPENILSEIKKSIPTQALGNPQNILEAIRLLIDADYITGTTIDINGGLV